MLDKNNIPQHIAIIMDGNGRWARQRRLPKIMGHRKGAESLREILKVCGEWGVRYLTVYVFSTENWKRPAKEVSGLMKLLEFQLDSQTKNLIKNNVRVNVIGRVKDLPQAIQIKLEKAIDESKDNTGVMFTLALSYGGRAEIVDGIKKILGDIDEGRLRREDITEDNFDRYLYTDNMPDPDLLIRTSGEERISNFLLWQLAYSEFYITKKLWPDFGRKDMEKAIEEYQKRQRRYGG